MSLRSLSRVEMEVTSEDDVVLARGHARTLAEERGFDAFATAAITTAASELARNIWVHAKSGMVIVEEIEDDSERVGLRLEFRDRGPGIADVGRVLAGGFSTARSLGLGLSGSRRLMDEFAIESALGKGTVITILKWKRTR
jgi:serine/threonine-protein kinase RsbT